MSANFSVPPTYPPSVTKLGMFQVDWCPRSDVPSSEGQPKAKTPKSKRVAGGLVSRDIYRGSNVPSCVSGRTLITSHGARPVNLRAKGKHQKWTNKVRGDMASTYGRCTTGWNPPVSRPVTLLVGTWRILCLQRHAPHVHRIPCTNTIRPTTDDDIPALFPFPFPPAVAQEKMRRPLLPPSTCHVPPRLPFRPEPDAL